MNPDTTGDDLVLRASAGSESALIELIRRHEPGTRALIDSRLPDRWRSVLSAEDVLQQTYLEAFLHIRTFSPRGEPAFAAWLRKLAEHHLIEVIRALRADKRGGKARQIRSDESTNLAELFEQVSGLPTVSTPSATACQSERREALMSAIQRLPDNYRAVVQKYDIERRDIAAVATEMGRSPGAIHLMRLRAHARLREILCEQITLFQSFA